MQDQAGAERRKESRRPGQGGGPCHGGACPPDVPQCGEIVARAAAQHGIATMSGERPRKQQVEKREEEKRTSVKSRRLPAWPWLGHQFRMRDNQKSAAPAPASCSQRSTRSRRKSTPPSANAAAAERKYQYNCSASLATVSDGAIRLPVSMIALAMWR